MTFHCDAYVCVRRTLYYIRSMSIQTKSYTKIEKNKTKQVLPDLKLTRNRPYEQNVLILVFPIFGISHRRKNVLNEKLMSNRLF